jgi:hypothetical protein
MASMQSVQLAVVIDRPATDVYAFVADPATMPQWAAGLSSSLEQIDGKWVADSPMGSVTIEFAPRNDFGVLDHTVALPDGTRVLNPLRVLPLGEASEVVFSLRRQPGMSDEEFEADRAAVLADLAALKRVLETD